MTMTDPGTVRLVLLSESVTVVAAAAALESVTVQVAEVFDPRTGGKQVSDESAGGTTAAGRTVTVAVRVEPACVAVILTAV